MLHAKGANQSAKTFFKNTTHVSWFLGFIDNIVYRAAYICNPSGHTTQQGGSAVEAVKKQLTVREERAVEAPASVVQQKLSQGLVHVGLAAEIAPFTRACAAAAAAAGCVVVRRVAPKAVVKAERALPEVGITRLGSVFGVSCLVRSVVEKGPAKCSSGNPERIRKISTMMYVLCLPVIWM